MDDEIKYLLEQVSEPCPEKGKELKELYDKNPELFAIMIKQFFDGLEHIMDKALKVLRYEHKVTTIDDFSDLEFNPPASLHGFAIDGSNSVTMSFVPKYHNEEKRHALNDQQFTYRYNFTWPDDYKDKSDSSKEILCAISNKLFEIKGKE